MGIPLIMTVVGTSSRGPQYQDFRIKPEIGAPGASISAEVGTGTGVTPFGGTSGAAPMVTGSAALLMDAFPDHSPAEIKARLMNNGETDILNEGAGALAPVSRIGGGEVRVDWAFMAPAVAWDDKDKSHPGALSFGFHEVNKEKKKLEKTVKVRNYSDEDIEYTITPTFRFADDAASGAVSITAPSSVKVKAGKYEKFKVKMEIDGTLLGGNYMHSGSGGANPALLNLSEFDGYLILDDGSHPIHLPWHVIPRKAAEMKTKHKDMKFGADGVAMVELENKGVGMAQNDVYSLLATSKNIDEGDRGEQNPTPDLRAVGSQTFGAGFCSSGYLLALATNNHERQAHANAPASMEWWLDIDQNGTDDYLVLSRDVSLNNVSDGRNLTWSVDLSTGFADAFFYTEHNVNTGTQVLYICGEQIGSPAFFQEIDARVVANDFYFGGDGDEIDGITFAPLGERYLPFDPDTGSLFPNLDLAYKEKMDMYVIDFGTEGTNPSEMGLMIVTNGDRGPGNRGAATEKTEALIIKAKKDKKHKKDKKGKK